MVQMMLEADLMVRAAGIKAFHDNGLETTVSTSWWWKWTLNQIQIFIYRVMPRQGGLPRACTPDLRNEQHPVRQAAENYQQQRSLSLVAAQPFNRRA